MDPTAIIVSAIALFGSLSGNLLLLRKVNAEADKARAETGAIQRKAGADATTAITDGAVDVVKILREQVELQDKEIHCLEIDKRELQKTIHRLETAHGDDLEQIRQLQFINAQLRHSLGDTVKLAMNDSPDPQDKDASEDGD